MSSQIGCPDHPSWCNRTECSVTTDRNGVHLSRTAQAESPQADMTVAVQLVQDVGVAPVVNLVFAYLAQGPDHPSEECEHRLDGNLAYAVGQILRTAGREASQQWLAAPG